MDDVCRRDGTHGNQMKGRMRQKYTRCNVAHSSGTERCSWATHFIATHLLQCMESLVPWNLTYCNSAHSGFGSTMFAAEVVFLGKTLYPNASTLGHSHLRVAHPDYSGLTRHPLWMPHTTKHKLTKKSLTNNWTRPYFFQVFEVRSGMAPVCVWWINTLRREVVQLLKICIPVPEERGVTVIQKCNELFS